MSELEYRFAPVAIEGRTLSGRVMRYGEISTGAPRPEKFLPGAFEFGDVILNVNHDRGRPIARTGGGGLELIDSPEALNLRADVPETREGTDALVSVRNRILRGLSVEFRALRETFEAGVRVIHRAQLIAVGLVDSPAYTGSTVEARAIQGVSMAWAVDYYQALQCECCPDADFVEFQEGAFEAALETKEILAVHGDYKGAIASKRRGTLRMKETKKGIEVESDISNTQAGRDLLEQAQDTEVLARPIVDFSKSESVVEGGVSKVKRAYVRGFILGPSDANEGWKPIRVIRADTKEKEGRMTCDSRGIPFWL